MEKLKNIGDKQFENYQQSEIQLFDGKYQYVIEHGPAIELAP